MGTLMEEKKIGGRLPRNCRVLCRAAVKKVKKGLAISREIDYNVVRFIIFLTN